MPRDTLDYYMWIEGWKFAQLDIMAECLTGNYLGLPGMVGMDRSDCFRFLVDRVCKRIRDGKEVLLKAIAQAIPTYAMSAFKISNKM
jgi:hypothetical protein